MTMTDDQLNKLTPKLNQPKTPQNANRSTETWDPAHDAEAEGMWGRIWDELETFTPKAMRLRKILGGHLLGDLPDPSEIPLLASVVEKSTSELLRSKAFSHLRNYVRHADDADRWKAPLTDLLSRHEPPAPSRS
jgi:hypothetical protein